MLSIVGEMIHVVVCPTTALEDRIEKVVDAVLELKVLRKEGKVVLSTLGWPA